LKFDEFKVGQLFKSKIQISEDEFRQYLEFSRVRNILHQNPKLAEKEGIKGTLLPGRAILARAEGEMTRLDEFADTIMLLYGMDGDTSWDNRNTRFLGEVLVGDDLEVEFRVSDKKEGNGTGSYSILSIDVNIKRVRDDKLVIVSHKNLYRMRK
jgi:acyl dehydratase